MKRRGEESSDFSIEFYAASEQVAHPERRCLYSYNSQGAEWRRNVIRLTLCTVHIYPLRISSLLLSSPLRSGGNRA